MLFNKSQIIVNWFSNGINQSLYVSPNQVSNSVVLYRAEAEGSAYYPFLNYTEALTICNGIYLKKSEQDMNHEIRSFGGGASSDCSPRCFVCRLGVCTTLEPQQ